MLTYVTLLVGDPFDWPISKVYVSHALVLAMISDRVPSYVIFAYLTRPAFSIPSTIS